MVSLIAPGNSRDARGRLYPRRNNRPWVILISLLAAAGLVVWIMALTKGDSEAGSMTCNNPTPPSGASNIAQPAPLGKRLSRTSLNDVTPAPLSSAKVRVLNANGEKGQAAQVASQLSDFGFAGPPGEPDGNDPVYTDFNLTCFSQIRFGPNGRAAAASVQLFAPCSELVQDTRDDDTVDLALGTVFSDSAPNDNAREVLHALKDLAPGVKPQPLEPSLLSAARAAKC